MDKYAIDIGVLSNTGGRVEKSGWARALELCQILNDAFADAHVKYPRRFMAFARLPMVDMDDCVRELERCYKQLNMHGVMMPTTPSGSRVTSTLTPGRTDGTTSPPQRSASPAKNLKM